VDEILKSATEALFLYAVQVTQSDTFNDIPNEYLEEVTTSYGALDYEDGKHRQGPKINFIQACLKSSFDAECGDALKKLTDKLGPNSSLNLQCSDKNQNTCLHLACLEPKPKTVKFLLENGLNDLIDAKNIMEKTAIQICLSDLLPSHGYSSYDDYMDPNILKLHQRCFSELLAKGATVGVSQQKILRFYFVFFSTVQIHNAFVRFLGLYTIFLTFYTIVKR
jgi:hypothetical protein